MNKNKIFSIYLSVSSPLLFIGEAVLPTRPRHPLPCSSKIVLGLAIAVLLMCLALEVSVAPIAVTGTDKVSNQVIIVAGLAALVGAMTTIIAAGTIHYEIHGARTMKEKIIDNIITPIALIALMPVQIILIENTVKLSVMVPDKAIAMLYVLIIQAITLIIYIATTAVKMLKDTLNTLKAKKK